MNNFFIFFIASSIVFILSLIVLCISPIINNTYIKEYNFKFSSWSTLNCKLFDDSEDYDSIFVEDMYNNQRNKKLCQRKKAMHDLEYAALIINLLFGFILTNLSLFQYLNIGKKIPKKVGLIGMIFGFCGLVLILVYISYNGFILVNDPAYNGKIQKKFPNGAIYKYVQNKYITAYEDDLKDDGQFIKYKDLGDKQYNYDKYYYKTYVKNPDECKFEDLGDFNRNNYRTGCEYIFPKPILNMENKNLYDKWVTSLVLDVIISVCNLCILILGTIIFIKNKNMNELENTIDN